MGDGFEFNTIELCQVPSCGRNRQVFYFRPKFAQKGIFGSIFIKLVTDSNLAPSNYARYQVVAEMDGPTFLRIRVRVRVWIRVWFIKYALCLEAGKSLYINKDTEGHINGPF